MSVIDKIKLDGTTYDVGKTPDTTLGISGAPADAAKVGTELNKKVDKVTGKGLSTEDFTTAEKTKLAGIAEGATNIVIDPTLFQSGKAADAQAVGNKFTEVSATAGKAFPTDTLSGDIVTFADGADDIPMKSVKVAIEPVQDLHGQDAPYPAGGGKNKFHNTGVTTTSNGVTFTVNADGTVSCSGTASGTAVFRVFLSYSDLPQGESLILNGCPAGGNFTSTYGTALCNINGASLDPATDSGAGVTYTPANLADLAQYQIVVRSGINTNGLVFKPMIRLASETDATYAPYSNICPISGWTGAQVVRTGVNVWDEEYQLGFYNTNGVFVANTIGYFSSKNPIPVKPNSEYVLCINGASNQTFYLLMYHRDGTFKSRLASSLIGGVRTITIPDDVYFIGFSTEVFYGTTYNHDISINYPATDHDYHPYTGNTYSITFPSEAGTVYGGELDVTNGVLTVDRIFATKKWGQMSSVHSGTTHSTKSLNFDANVLKGGQNSITNITAAYIEKTTEQSTHYYVSSNMKTVYVTLPNDTNADTDIQVCGTLEEPIIYTLTPTEIKSLLGDNNIWADCGDSTVEYRADTAMYIDKKIAEVINALS